MIFVIPNFLHTKIQESEMVIMFLSHSFPLFGITISSALDPLSRIQDNGSVSISKTLYPLILKPAASTVAVVVFATPPF